MVPDGGRVTVVVHFDAPTTVPIVGALVGDLALDAEAMMARHGAPVDWPRPGGPGGSGHGIRWEIWSQNPPQQCDRARFVERIVAVATFRGLHA